MIVFDLSCGHGHRFEAWFNSSAGYADQRARGLIACPVCGDTAVDKAVMAPRVAAKGNQRSADIARAPSSRPASERAAQPTEAPLHGNMPMMTGAPSPAEAQLRAIVAAVAAKQAEMLPKSRWVGRDFAPAARAMHEGRADAELIHGSVSPDEAAALHADGVAALPLIVPFVPPEQAN
jgi:hypothetical protein